MIGPGDLDRRLVLEAPVETIDDQGGVMRVYAATMELWAAVTPLRGREAVAAGARGADITHRIVVRGKYTITLRHQLREDDDVFRIVAIRERDDGRFIEIDAELRID